MAEMKKYPLILALVTLVSGASVLAQEPPSDEAGFTDYIAKILGKEIDPTAVTIKGPLTLTIGDIQANLDRIFGFCRRNASGCASEIKRYTMAVSEVVRLKATPVTPEAVRLVIRPEAYIQRVLGPSVKDAPVLQYRPLVPGLFVVAVLDSPQTLRPLNERDLAKLGMTQDQLFQLGTANLTRTLEPLSVATKPATEGQIRSLTGSVYEVGRLAIHPAWAELARAQNGTLVVALPTTDLVLYISESSPAAIDALRALAKNTSSRAPNALSPLVLKWTPERWELVP